MINIEALKKMLIAHEGLKLKVYVDSVGIPTIGSGRNLQDVGISHEEAMLLLANDIDRSLADLDRVFPWWRTLSDVRQLVLADMVFNLGITRLTLFKKFIAALQAGEYDLAAAEMLSSKWAGQVGIRAQTLAGMMSTNLL